jgi:hypothetical protein
MDVKKVWTDWRRLGDVGEGLMMNPIALIAPAFLVSATTIGLLGKPYQSVIGAGWSFLAWIGLSLAGTVFVAWATSPLWGMFYLRRIESDFGPKTRARVWEWFGSERELEADSLSLERVAWECGESNINPDMK